MTVALMDISLDRSYKWRYNPVVQKRRVKQYHTGPQAMQTLPGIPSALTINAANALYVNVESGNDSTGTGTSGNPYKTMNKGADMATATYCYVLATYTTTTAFTPGDGPFTTNNNAYFKGCFAVAGKTIYWTHRILGYTPSDSNTIYVKKTGSDSNVGTYAAPVLTLTGTTGAISKVTAARSGRAHV